MAMRLLLVGKTISLQAPILPHSHRDFAPARGQFGAFCHLFATFPPIFRALFTRLYSAYD